MMFDNTQKVFLHLVRAGLWEKRIQLSSFRCIDLGELFRIAQEQTVGGLVAAGMEYVEGIQIPQEIKLAFIGNAIQIEQCNTAMNSFISSLFSKLDLKGVKALLVKGQGIAQCYERPLWRVCGDVDLLLCENDYNNAIDFLGPISSSMKEEHPEILHQAFTIENWEVELHGTLRSELGKRIDKVIDQVVNDTFLDVKARVWNNNDTVISLPAPNYDTIIIFTHILQHYFIGGIGLRQVCDWCRLLYVFRESLDVRYIENQLKKMGLVEEWKVFAVLAVDFLGAPKEIIPLYTSSCLLRIKAQFVMRDILKTGNFGHNRDLSYQNRDHPLIRRVKTFSYITGFTLRHSLLFPAISARVWFKMVNNSNRAI